MVVCFDEKPVRVCVRLALDVVAAAAGLTAVMGVVAVIALPRVAAAPVMVVVAASADSVVMPPAGVYWRVVAAVDVAAALQVPLMMMWWCNRHGGVAPDVAAPVAIGENRHDHRDQRNRASLPCSLIVHHLHQARCHCDLSCC